MADRSWFFASQGQQQGPYYEAQLRDLIAKGTVTAATLVWSEGMADWQKAGDIPGLFSGYSGPPAVPGSQRSVAGAGGEEDGGSLSIDFEILEFVWRTLVLFIGAVFVIPLPWVFVMYCKWIVSCMHVPGRPNLTFEGQPLTILWWCLGAIVLIIGLGLTGIRYVNALGFVIQLGLYWLALKWLIANIASNGQLLGLSFSGSFWGYLGWNVLAALSVFTIIGWAWVYTAQLRWICRHIEGTRREAVFKASGLEYLWRCVVTALACAFIIPIPWVARWMMRWHVSQIDLVERTA
jgi:heme/copper-type cytochrome/quinol oxidase subunit 2